MIYPRPIPMSDSARPEGALPLAGTALWFDRVELLERGRGPRTIPAAELDAETRACLSAPRPDLAGLALDHVRLMGILNVTPDSFSDGGRYLDSGGAAPRAAELVRAGAEILDIGGESTRPGSFEVAVDEEIARITPAIREAAPLVPVSVDTRKAAVGRQAVQLGASMLNDVSGLLHDPDLALVAAESGAPLIVMHMRGTPETMQGLTDYDDVLLDVYDELAERLAAAEAAGIPRVRLIADPGIGFAKTTGQNLALIRNLSLFHNLGVPLLLGVSRKRFIGNIAGIEAAAERMPGSIAMALEGARQGAHVIRVHDVAATRQALALWFAVTGGRNDA